MRCSLRSLFGLLAIVSPGFDAAAQTPAPPTYQQVVAGNGFSCALTTTGSVLCWGDNDRGILGDAPASGSLTPVPVAPAMSFRSLTSGNSHVCGLMEGGEAYCWGDNRSGALGSRTGRDCSMEYVGQISCARNPVRVSGNLLFGQIAAGGSHTCGLVAPRIYCWGINAQGQLGDGSTQRRGSPVLVASNQSFEAVMASGSGTCGRTTEGAFHCWGMNPRAPAGEETRHVYATNGRPLDGLFSQVVPGECGLTMGGTPICQGSTTSLTGVSSGLVSAVFTELRLLSLSSGTSAHRCGLTADGTAYCWNVYEGSRIGGPLGNAMPPTPMSDSIKFKQITTGFAHACGVTLEGAVYCWGSNSDGQLGNGTTDDASVPVSATPSGSEDPTPP